MPDICFPLQLPAAIPRFSFIDLFAGIGGMRRGFESAGGQCIFTSEWDVHCQKAYRANYPCNHPLTGDITQIAAHDIPPHDVLLAGFPCQPFSLAGVSKRNSLGIPHGFLCDTQGTLFFEVARILAHHRPAAFLLENVRNLKSHDGGKTFATMLHCLRHELGYSVQSRILNAHGYVPQNRERLFIVGFREHRGFDFDALTLPDNSYGPTLSNILHPGDGTETPEPPYTDGPLASVAEKYTLSDKLWQCLQRHAEHHRQKGNGFGFGLVGPDDVARTLSARYHKDGSEILIRQANRPPRRLTPRECVRLMGYDLPGALPFRIVVSDTQAYKQFGNSVVVPLIKAIASQMAPFIA